MELLSGGLFGGLLGGLFRLVPEVLKWLDRKNEREHERLMFEQQCKLTTLQGSIRLEEVREVGKQAVDVGVMEAFKASIESQTEMIKMAGKSKIAALSASVRPVITYFILLVWSCAHMWFAIKNGTSAVETYKLIMSVDFVALVSGVVNYWFLDRTLSKRGL